MKYFLLSDIHGSVTQLVKVLDIYRSEHCDMLLLLGDILNYGHTMECQRAWMPRE